MVGIVTDNFVIWGHDQRYSARRTPKHTLDTTEGKRGPGNHLKVDSRNILTKEDRISFDGITKIIVSSPSMFYPSEETMR